MEQALLDVSSGEAAFTASQIDKDNRTVTLYFNANRDSSFDMSAVKLGFSIAEGAVLNNKADSYDLSSDFTLDISFRDSNQLWTVYGKTATNPVINGEYADPDIDYFNGKYYIYPTTDGFSGWSGTQFHCFSSEDMVTWVDEGIILDVANNYVTGTDNANNIPGVPWAVGSAWAPTIEEKGGMYYFYFCAKRSDGVSCIGVAVSESPTGPFKALDEPLLTPEVVLKEIKISGQTIDPSIFTDDDGTSYMLFGNGYGAAVQLNDEMTGWVEETMHYYVGATDIRESIVVFKKDGLYHFTWSCDDTGSENYHINYGYSDSLYGKIKYVGRVLVKNTELGILGTGHQSVLHDPVTGNYYMAYHRFVTPAGIYLSDYGVHRETCIDLITFDEDTGLIKEVIPTH